ncbi:MAG: rhodanese-like domain-containing protein [Nitrospiraceae bacterium]|nr:rhodanese-like domain-containing protein [Nitrospiraceae bacterium]MSR25078.1 rhodanese-like domain-containing protein [Nitrospiraceae bacterium]
MTPTRLLASLALGITLIVGGSQHVSAYHSYVISVQKLKATLEKAPDHLTKGFFLVDVRSPQEHAGGVIPGTDRNIEFSQMKTRHHEIGAKSDDHIVVYCQSGHRSNIAAETLADLGYKHVYNVGGSMNAWQAAGYEIQPAPR